MFSGSGDCLPCIESGCASATIDGDVEWCNVCWTESLLAAPCVQVSLMYGIRSLCSMRCSIVDLRVPSFKRSFRSEIHIIAYEHPGNRRQRFANVNFPLRGIQRVGTAVACALSIRAQCCVAQMLQMEALLRDGLTHTDGWCIGVAQHLLSHLKHSVNMLSSHSALAFIFSSPVVFSWIVDTSYTPRVAANNSKKEGQRQG